MHTIVEMDAASTELADLDGLSVAQLKAMLHEKHAQLVAKDALLLSYAQQLTAMQLKLLKLLQMQFGKRSDKRAQEIEQLELWVEQLEAVTVQRSCELAARAGATSTASVTKPRREFGLHLPHQTQMIASHDANYPSCSGELKHLGDDISEILELEPVRFTVIRQVRPTLACASCDTIVQAPAPIGRH